MKISKKIVSILTATALVASLTGCGSNGSSSKKYTIGICQLMEHEALDAATKGFKDTLTKKLGKDNVEFDEQNAQGESTNCSTICNGFLQMPQELFRQLLRQLLIFQFSAPLYQIMLLH